MDNTKLKKRLSDGECVFGPFVRIPDPAVIEAIGYAGCDFAIIDTEHGSMGMHQAENLVRAAKLSGIAPIIRVRENSETMIVRALDTAASGVQIPQIGSEQAAIAGVSASKFYPNGSRGVCRFTRNAEYSNVPVLEYFGKANENSLVILQIEGMEGVRNINRILEVPGIDILFLGPYDLSQSLGLTGQVAHPQVLKVIEEIVKKARDKGLAVGSFSDDRQTLRLHRQLGIQYLSFGVDTGIIYQSVKSILNEISFEPII